jgi:hypothetical protein
MVLLLCGVCAGLVFQPPTPTGQVCAVKANDRSLAGCGRHMSALKQLAASCWGLNRHPGWTLVPEQLVSNKRASYSRLLRWLAIADWFGGPSLCCPVWLATMMPVLTLVLRGPPSTINLWQSRHTAYPLDKLMHTVVPCQLL